MSLSIRTDTNNVRDVLWIILLFNGKIYIDNFNDLPIHKPIVICIKICDVLV